MNVYKWIVAISTALFSYGWVYVLYSLGDPKAVWFVGLIEGWLK